MTGSPPKSNRLFIYPLPTFPDNFIKSVRKFLRKVADKLTKNDDYITSLSEVITISVLLLTLTVFVYLQTATVAAAVSECINICRPICSFKITCLCSSVSLIINNERGFYATFLYNMIVER